MVSMSSQYNLILSPKDYPPCLISASNACWWWLEWKNCSYSVFLFVEISTGGQRENNSFLSGSPSEKADSLMSFLCQVRYSEYIKYQCQS